MPLTSGGRVDRLHEIKELKDKGLFREALAVCDKLSRELSDRWSFKIIRAELLERVGQTDEAITLVHRALSSKTLTLSDRSICELVLARVSIERGSTANAIVHLNRSISDAKRANDLERACEAQLKLLSILSNGAGADATGPLLADVRASAMKCGNPRVLASVHVYCAQIEALRGSIKTSRRHIRMALQLLREAPSSWLECVIENIGLAVSIMASEFGVAEAHAAKGRALAERCGGAIEYAVNQGNSGFLWQVLGRLDEAVECYERAISLFAPGSDNHRGAIDSLARVRLAQGRLDECEELLNRIDDSAKAHSGVATYVQRHLELTPRKRSPSQRRP
jgi:tetratricopeptide (TPR) repeat protein